MTKKNKIIFVLILFVVLIIGTSTILLLKSCNREPSEPTETTLPSGAGVTNVNITEPSVSVEESHDGVFFEDATYQHVEYLSFEQKADIDSLIKLVEDFSINNKKEVYRAEVLPTSNNQVTFMTVTYTDGNNVDLAITFDRYNTHSYMRCGTKEYYDAIENGYNVE